MVNIKKRPAVIPIAPEPNIRVDSSPGQGPILEDLAYLREPVQYLL
jgi:hypothetical protein